MSVFVCSLNGIFDHVRYDMTSSPRNKHIQYNYSAPLQASPTAEALRYMARTKQRRTYLPYTFPAVAGTSLFSWAYKFSNVSIH